MNNWLPLHFSKTSLLRKILHFINAALPPVMWAAFIYFLSSQPALPGLKPTLLDYIFKNTSHMFVYAVLYALIWRAVALYSNSKQQASRWLLPLVITMLYAISDELHQSLIAGRTASIYDIGYDFIGTMASLLMLRQHN